MDYEYSNLTEAQKEEMIFRQKDVKEGEKKEQNKNASSERGRNDIFGGPSIG